MRARRTTAKRAQTSKTALADGLARVRAAVGVTRPPREELVEREHQARLREHEEWQKRLEERCRKAEADFQASHPWLAPGMCVTVPVRRVAIPD